ncbi:hypothetical protein V496_02444 [Pseudogymnoascus sp. VKM F-4515 (FW-2607)]|nr:hypothetical protein V496_02444 [Pseudogymnoascus sp. VKM F-4515 (FW-2607)]
MPPVAEGTSEARPLMAEGAHFSGGPLQPNPTHKLHQRGKTQYLWNKAAHIDMTWGDQEHGRLALMRVALATTPNRSILTHCSCPCGCDGRLSSAERVPAEQGSSAPEQRESPQERADSPQYREFHGRTFHNFPTTEYWGPNDAKQNEHLDIGHHMLTLPLDGKLFLAPISPTPQKVIDVGTGTGIWAIDFVDVYPSAMVIGTDLSPIQPNFVPPNLKFELDDAQLESTYGENSFGFVHIRCLIGGINDWAKLYSEVFRCTKRGGYVESLEINIQFTSDDGSVEPGHIMYDWSTRIINAGETMRRTFKIPKISKRLTEASRDRSFHHRWFLLFNRSRSRL